MLTADERTELEGWARRRSSAAGLAMRVRIVLAAADGGNNNELADRLELSITTVRRWRNRFAVERLTACSTSRARAGPVWSATSKSKT